LPRSVASIWSRQAGLFGCDGRQLRSPLADWRLALRIARLRFPRPLLRDPLTRQLEPVNDLVVVEERCSARGQNDAIRDCQSEDCDNNLGNYVLHACSRPRLTKSKPFQNSRNSGRLGMQSHDSGPFEGFKSHRYRHDPLDPVADAKCYMRTRAGDGFVARLGLGFVNASSPTAISLAASIAPRA
jgi:hypothetical protein